MAGILEAFWIIAAGEIIIVRNRCNRENVGLNHCRFDKPKGQRFSGSIYFLPLSNEQPGFDFIMIRIALVSPKGPLYRHDGGIFTKSLRAAPITLTTLAALIPKEIEATVRLIDEGIEEIPEDVDADLVGMTVITGTAPRSYELSARFRADGKTVVLGGPHVTLIPDEARLHADAIVVGYAEASWPQLLRDYAAGALRPRYDMAADFSLDKPEHLPFPRRDLLKKKRYRTTFTFEATRGCCHDCEFCVVPTAWGRVPYLKPVSHVIDDIRQSGARRCIFYDLNLIANRTYAKELFTALIPLKVQWFGLATTLLDDTMAELMARSGCHGLLIGFESLRPDVLANVGKRFNRPEKYTELVKRLHALGILINGTFVFGNDADTVESFAAVKDFVLTNGIDLPRFSILTPFPNTPLFKRLEREGRITTRDWQLYDGQHVVFEPKLMSASTLLTAHEALWRDVYSFPGILQRTRHVLADWGRKLLVTLYSNLGYRHYAYNLHRFYNCAGGVA